MAKEWTYKAYCCDSVQGLNKLNDKSIKLVYGSPPYPNADRNYGNWSSSEYIQKISPFIDSIIPKLRDDGFLVINVKANRDKALSGKCTTRSLVVEKLAILLEEKWGLYCVDIEIWIKENPVPTGLRCACQDAYEQNLWFSKSPKWTINIDAIRRPYDGNSLKAYANNEYKPRTNGLSYVRKAKRIEPNPKGALPLNIIKGAVSSKQTIHQAVQPGYLPEKYIKAVTKEGDIVVDPWMGTGTTGYEALKLKRKFIGFDINKQFVDFAQAMLSDLETQLRNRSKLSSDRQQLQTIFLNSLGDAVESHSTVSERPLDVVITKPYRISLKVYLFPNTNPPGGRRFDEYKFNLNVPGQQRGEKGNFDYSDGVPFLVSYTEDYDVFIIYEARMHRNFSCNANVQSKQSLILDAYKMNVAKYKKTSGELLIGVKSKYLLDGIKEWWTNYIDKL